MRQLRTLFEPHNPNSLSNRFRAARFQFFLSLVEQIEKNVDRPLTILDVGGMEHFWAKANFLERAQITILNLDAPPAEHPNITSVAGDARSMPQYADKSFDLVFSNSVIEHVGTLEDQRRMANEVRRIGRDYFVQTPNFWFPIEPHALFPGFQWLPVAVRSRLLQRFSLGHLDREPDLKNATEAVRSIRLMTRSELETLFPDGDIWYEKFFGLNKSMVMYRVASSEQSWEKRLKAAVALTAAAK